MDRPEDAEPTGDIPEPDEPLDGRPDGAGHPGRAGHPYGDGRHYDELNSSLLDDDFVAGATIHEPSASERLDACGAFTGPGDIPGGVWTESGFEPTRVFITTSRSGPPDHDAEAIDEELHRRSLRRRRRRRRTINVLALLVVVATFAVYGLDHFVTGIQLLPWTRMNRSLSGNEAPDGDTAIAPPTDDNSEGPTDRPAGDGERARIIRGDNWPPAPREPSDQRVLPPVTATTTGPHEFIMTQDDGSGPVAFDPCRPIAFVVAGSSQAPVEGRQLLDEAIAEVSRVTGLAFVDEGTTTERPSDQRHSYQPDRYGQRWAPVLVAWSDPTESPRLAENTTDSNTPNMDVLGYAGSNAVGLRTVQPGTETDSDSATPSSDGADGSHPDRMIYVTGSVTLDGPDFASLLQTPGGYEIARAAIMHELAHLVGLGHIDDSAQLMYPAIQPGVTSFGGGDLEGLAALGSGVCMPEI